MIICYSGKKFRLTYPHGKISEGNIRGCKQSLTRKERSLRKTHEYYETCFETSVQPLQKHRFDLFQFIKKIQHVESL